MNAPSLSGEDTVVLPVSWRGHLHVRRGGIPGPNIKIHASAADELRARIAEQATLVENAFTRRQSDAALVARVRAYLNGEADPLGAAGLAVILVQVAGEGGGGEFDRLADAWVIEHGLVFAARALVELSGIRADPTRVQDRKAVALQRARDSKYPVRWWQMRQTVRRVRGLLAVADEAVYQAAEEALAGLRDAPSRAIVVSYLLPTRQDWVDECCAHEPPTKHASSMAWMLWCSAGAAGTIARLGSWAQMSRDTGVMASAIEGAGVALVPYLATGLQGFRPDEEYRRVLNALAILPSDDAFRLLLDRADEKQVRPLLVEALRRFPERGLRLLASVPAASPRKASAAASALLAEHLAANTDLVAEVLPGLPETARQKIESVSATRVRSAEAAAEDLPELLVSPPWTRERSASRPVVLDGLTPRAEPELVWADGEWERWQRAAGGYSCYAGTNWRAVTKEVLSERDSTWYKGALYLINGPEGEVRALLADWTPAHLFEVEPMLPLVVARFGLDALPLALRVGRENPGAAGPGLMPYRDVEVARLMADSLARLKSARPVATRWFARHGEAAARLLVPDALGKAGQERRNAEGALLLIASRVGAGTVVAAAREHGEEAASAIETLLTADPLLRLPARIPKAGTWADPVVLPQVLLRDRQRALPSSATAHLITMLAMSPPGQEYAGLDTVRRLCDPASLAEFGWALFLRWQAMGAPSKDGWAFMQLGIVGDDETVRRLSPLIRAWPGEGGHKRAVAGLDVLAAIGTEVALMHLYGIAQKVKFKALKTRAQEKIAHVADELGLTPDRLADRLVPDFGLDAGGSLTLDFGPRRFTVGFDEQLKPRVADEDGKIRKALPKPGGKDDAALASDAHKRFAALKKDVRTIAAQQLHRLESAMTGRRRWTGAEFHDLFAAHPLVCHLVRRLVWLAEDGGGTTPFRLAEDRSLADVGDDVLTLPESALIGIAHPVDLGDAVDAWAEVFADYEIVQPFPQLGRPVHLLTEQERQSGRLARFEGVTVPVGKIYGLERHGWELAPPEEGGWRGRISRPLPGSRHVVISLEPGITAGLPEDSVEQTLDSIAVDEGPSFGDLHPVVASEILNALTDLTSKA